MMPFPGGIESSANSTLVMSAAAAILCLMVGDAGRIWLRILLAAVPATALAALAVTERGPLPLAAALLATAAMAALSQLDDKRWMPSGLAAVHLAWLALFGWSAPGWTELASGWRPASAATIALLTLALIRATWRRSTAMPMAFAAACLTGAAAAIAALGVPDVRVAGGALLLAISSGLLLAGRVLMTAIPADNMRRAAWVLGYVAQLSITLGYLLGAGPGTIAW